MIELFTKQVLALLASGLTFVAFYPYVRGLMRNTLQPHVFSWVIWSTTTWIAFFAQVQGNAGIGAWPIGLSAAITAGIAVVAYLKRGDIAITRSDWHFFVGALLSIPLWHFTSSPTAAVVVLTVVDLLGFGPTLRKAYSRPHSESMAFYTMFAVRNLLVIGALEHYSIATALFPAAIGAACIALVGLIAYRRQRVSRETIGNGTYF